MNGSYISVLHGRVEDVHSVNFVLALSDQDTVVLASKLVAGLDLSSFPVTPVQRSFKNCDVKWMLQNLLQNNLSGGKKLLEQKCEVDSLRQKAKRNSLYDQNHQA